MSIDLEVETGVGDAVKTGLKCGKIGVEVMEKTADTWAFAENLYIWCFLRKVIFYGHYKSKWKKS